MKAFTSIACFLSKFNVHLQCRASYIYTNSTFVRTVPCNKYETSDDG
jgi:hypothetical protein